MLKRLSFGNSSSDQLQLPALGITTSTYSQSSSRSPNQQPIYSTSPTSIASSAPRSRRNSNNTASHTNANDKRNEQESIQSLNTFLKQLNQILISFNELKELVTAVARAEKRLSKELIALVTGNGFEKDGPSYRRVKESIIVSGGMFETLAEVDNKWSKIVQKEYDSLNSSSEKYFKKVAKAEKSTSEAISSLELRSQKASNSYSTSLASPSAHSIYLTTHAHLTNAIQELKVTHFTALKETQFKMVKEISRSFCGLGQASWEWRVEGMRKGGERIGRVVEEKIWCELDLGEEMINEMGLSSPSASNVAMMGPRPLPQSRQNSSQSLNSQFPETSSSLEPSLLPPPNASFRSRSSSINSNRSYQTSSPLASPRRATQPIPIPQQQQILSPIPVVPRGFVIDVEEGNNYFAEREAGPEKEKDRDRDKERDDTMDRRRLSERSFVASMKARYAEEKELKDRENIFRSRESMMDHSSSNNDVPLPALPKRSNSRVSDLAQRYSSSSLHVITSAPTIHSNSASLPMLSSSSPASRSDARNDQGDYNEFGLPKPNGPQIIRRRDLTRSPISLETLSNPSSSTILNDSPGAASKRISWA